MEGAEIRIGKNHTPAGFEPVDRSIQSVDESRLLRLTQ